METVAREMAGCNTSAIGAAHAALGLIAWAASWCVACSRDEPATAAEPAPTASQPAPASEAAIEPTPEPPPKGPPVRLFASQFVVNVRERPAKEAFRMGYLRGGAVVQAKTAEPIGFDKCRKGWFELERGGFVCSTVDAIAFSGKRLPERQPLQADLGALLPYPYGYARRKGTPVYKRIPNAEELELHEAPPAPAEAPVEGAAASAPTPPSPPAPPSPAPAQGAAPPAGGTSDAGVPTLASLQGEAGSVLLRRMERGFYVSLDRELRRGGRAYYRTQSNGYIPSAALAPVKPTTFGGVELGQGMELPIAFVLSSKYTAYRLDPKGRLRSAGKPGYHHMFHVAGEAEIKGKAYLVGDDGIHYRVSDVTKLEPRAKPAEVGDDEKWLDVDLGAQSLIAYVGERPVYATLVSTGRIKDELDPQKNFATPTGAFRISSKHLTATMDGDHAIDGPYSIEDVPYVMYFELAYALHAAFWHNGFGRPRSHGCINLAPTDARFVFGFVDPTLPEPWHGVYPTEAAPGTRLYVRGVTPEG